MMTAVELAHLYEQHAEDCARSAEAAEDPSRHAFSSWRANGGATSKRQSMIAQMPSLFVGHIRDGEKLASVRERDPGVAQPYVMFAFFDVVCFFCK
jgi:hypothetical protein